MSQSNRRRLDLRMTLGGLYAAVFLIAGLSACNPKDPDPAASEIGNPAGADASSDSAGGTESGAVQIGEGDVPGSPMANVQFVRAVQVGETQWRFEVTLLRTGSGDKGYIDGWDVVLPDDTVLTLAPGDRYTKPLERGPVAGESFESMQGDLEIPIEITDIRVRAHDSIEGFGGREVMVYLDMQSAPDFEVVHTW